MSNVLNESTNKLIVAYTIAVANRYKRCGVGSSRAASRQKRIDAIVNELSKRADNNDREALAWYELTAQLNTTPQPRTNGNKGTQDNGQQRRDTTPE